ncbi:hypothetical protein [Spongiibacter sp.]|uniref:hypothetical protein n=1 Tax=Spongiibacter sp. TaxID=2024860 RepID=UPI003563E9EB
MLFKEKLLLSNCDSVKKLSHEEVRKRFLTGLTFADGVVVSPNTLIDNVSVHQLISQRNVVKYLNEEGLGKFVIRGFNLSNEFSLVAYFESLPGDFILSSLPGSPRKSQLSQQQRHELIGRLVLTETAIKQVKPSVETMRIDSEALSTEIARRLVDDTTLGYFSGSKELRERFLAQTKGCVSRSQWYENVEKYTDLQQNFGADVFKAEVIDPAYNSLFAASGEGFLQDNIKIINSFPEIFLDSMVSFKALRNEIEYLDYPIKAFEIITSLGSLDVLKLITDEALGYIEGKFSDAGKNYFSRKNWFGMYNVMKTKIGLEVK